ncbi:MAG: hypothetical protein FWG46_03335 [Treponema sp.]|nr:hypothetical protein [Treponema sp.]
MNNNWKRTLIFLVLSLLYLGCQTNEKIIIMEIQQKHESEHDNYKENFESNIIDFYFYEIMKGNTSLNFHREEYKVIELFGEPLKINIQSVLFNFIGGTVVELHEYVYDDFTHIYYIFENGLIFYIEFFIEKKLERLQTINIGDTSDKLLSTFHDKYYKWNEIETLKENISYYTDPDVDPAILEIQFIIKDKIIQKIFINFVLS